MSSVAIVLAIVFSGICISEYQHNATDVNEALTSSIDRAVQASEHGSGPFGFGNFASDAEPNSFGSPDSDNDKNGKGRGINDIDGNGRENGFAGPRIGGRNGERRDIVPVAVYTFTETSTFTMASGFATASIDSEVLQTASTRISDVQDGSGTFTDLGLHYQKRTVDSTTYVAFADTSTTDSWKSLALTLGIAGLATLAVFFLISLALSKWALKPVKEAWESQRQFVADASHDLKTPLTVILANASILLKHPDHSIASESQWIESTQVEAEHMQGLVNEMLELAQVEAGQEKQSMPHEPVDFSDLVDGETLLFDSVALERNCLFDCSIEEGIQVLGNEQQLHKMVSTLVENAFKYVNEGGSIDISLCKAGKNAVLAVRNTGSTISEEDLPHIFDRFYRTDKARTSGAGGFGLGLAIAREIARSHGGDISCTSTDVDGTTFTVTLPAA